MSMTAFSSRVYLLRHGELTTKDVLAGHTDFILSETGVGQLNIACGRLANIDLVTSSSLKRCSEFARQFCDFNKIPLNITDDIKEFNFGDWDGQSYDELWQHTKTPTIGDFWQSPWLVTPPNGESMAHFYQRITTWWQQLLVNTICQGTRSQLVITHAGVIKQLLAIICQVPKQLNYQNIFTVGYGKVICIDIFFDENGQAWPKIIF